MFHSSKKDEPLEEFKYKLDNLPYELYDKITNDGFSVPIPIMKTVDETLDNILQDKCPCIWKR